MWSQGWLRMSPAEVFYSPSMCDQCNPINYWIKLEACTGLQIPAREPCYRGIYNMNGYQPLNLPGYSRKTEKRHFFLCVSTANTYSCFSLLHSVSDSNIVLCFQWFLTKYVHSQESEPGALNTVCTPSRKSQTWHHVRCLQTAMLHINKAEDAKARVNIPIGPGCLWLVLLCLYAPQRPVVRLALQGGVQMLRHPKKTLAILIQPHLFHSSLDLCGSFKWSSFLTVFFWVLSSALWQVFEGEGKNTGWHSFHIQNTDVGSECYGFRKRSSPECPGWCLAACISLNSSELRWLGRKGPWAWRSRWCATAHQGQNHTDLQEV